MPHFNQIKLIVYFLLLTFFGKLGAEVISEEFLQVEEVEGENLYELIENYMDNRLDWQQGTIAELRKLPLQSSLIERLVKLKKDKAEIKTWRQLGQRTKLSKREVRVIKMFITMGKIKNYRGEYKLYNKLKHSKKHLNYNKNCQKIKIVLPSGGYLGGVTEWDEGEQEIWDHRNITYRSPLIKEKIRLYAGSYKINSGYGLVFSNSLFSMRSVNPSYNLKPGALKTYNTTSSNEYNYLFGTAIDYQADQYQVTPFWSRKGIDGHVENGIIKNISKTGEHVTEGQIKRKNNILQNQYGIAFNYDQNFYSLGMLGYYSDYGRKFAKIGSSNLAVVALNHSFKFQSWLLSGETAFAGKSQWAFKEALLFKLDEFVLGVSYRYFSPQYFCDLASTVRHYSGPLQNEKGVNFGFSLKLPRNFGVKGYIDYFSRIEPQGAGENIPVGSAFVTQLIKKFNPRMKLWLKYKKLSEQYFSIAYFQRVKRQFKVKSLFELTPGFNMINRFVYNKLSIGGTQETGIGINNSLEIQTERMVIDFGTTNFFTESYASRVYLYEPGIPFRFNLPVLYGAGTRFFVTINYRINEIFLLYFVCSYFEQKKVKQDYMNRQHQFELQLEINL